MFSFFETTFCTTCIDTVEPIDDTNNVDEFGFENHSFSGLIRSYCGIVTTIVRSA